MALFKLDPLTRKRIARFRRIKRGYYSLLILLAATFISLFSEYLANDRAILVRYQGKFYFPTFKFLDMATFGQEDDLGMNTGEAHYARLQEDWAKEREKFEKEIESSDSAPSTIAQIEARYPNREHFLILPLIPWHPERSDKWYYSTLPPNPPDFSRKHYLGTDSTDRDVAARLLYGFRTSIFFALFLVLAGQSFGIFIGCLQGYLGGKFDILSQRFIEIWSSLPFLYIVVIMTLFFTPGFWMLLFIMALFQWITITYYMRTEMYREKTREYCLAAKSYGASHLRIIFRHLLPNCMTPIVTLTPFAIVGAISALTGLDYLGYGLPAPAPSWGEMIDQALSVENRDKIWLSLSPFAAISLTLILVTFIGESVREAFDPKQYAKYE